MNESQLGLVIYEYLLDLISTDIRFQYVVNSLKMLEINFLIWELTNRCFHGDHKIILFVLLFPFDAIFLHDICL